MIVKSFIAFSAVYLVYGLYVLLRWAGRKSEIERGVSTYYTMYRRGTREFADMLVPNSNYGVFTKVEKLIALLPLALFAFSILLRW